MLRGSLDDFGLEDILWLIDHAENTGELAVTRPNGSGRLFFRDGKIYCAESDFLREPLADQLVRTTGVAATQLEEAQSRKATSGERLGEALLTVGAVDEDGLGEVFRTRVEDAAFELLRREFGEFAWESGAKAEPEFSLSLSVEELLDAVAGRFSDLEKVREVIPSETSVPAISAVVPEGATEVTVTAEQWRLVALVDGTRSFEDIGGLARLSDFYVMKTVRPLAERGLIRVADTPVEAFQAAAAARAEAAVEEKPFEIALVCTGNRVRSPMAEAFLRALLKGEPVELLSVGVESYGSQPPIPAAVAAAAELGGDLSQHRARGLAEVDLSSADLVVGFERAHVAYAIEGAGARADRSFTLIEVLEYLDGIAEADEGDEIERARSLIAMAHEARTRRGLSSRDLDLRDPLGGPPEGYRETGVRIRSMCERLARHLFPND
ncbi:MAG: DUF4388 domain-containing protein [Actinomycetota bacterium]|nr:DUF4388 domain-containing protein [Actinomycetota bacterium]